MAAIAIRNKSAQPRQGAGPALFSAGFRPFFLLAAVWSALALPLWLYVYTGEIALPSAFPPVVWHVHEMVFGYAFATVAGFLLTAIPNWTGRLPLRGTPLALLAGLWVAGRVAVLYSNAIGAPAAAIIDLAFPVAFAAVIARELIAGRNWRNLPMLAALALLFCGNALVHLQIVGIADTAELGNRLGLFFLWCNRPYSRGQVQLTSRDPMTAPQVDLNLLSDERDVPAIRIVHRGRSQSSECLHLRTPAPVFARTQSGRPPLRVSACTHGPMRG